MEWNESIKSIITALGIGLMIGVIRERHGQEPIAGVRTHALVALVGVVTMQMDARLYLAALLAVGALAVAAYLRNDKDDLGLTGEVALLVTMALAGFATHNMLLAAALGVVAASLLQGKTHLQHISRNLITENELHDVLLLAAAALVIMPLLPAAALDPWGAIKPRTVWKVVMLIMAVGMAGHIALRAVGVRWGLALAGFFSGFASSTAAVAGFGQRVRAEPALLAQASAAAILANLASFILLLIVVWAAAPDLLLSMALPLGAALFVLLACGALGLRGGQEGAAVAQEASGRAFKLTHALLIAGLIAFVSFLSAWLRQHLGDTAAVGAAILVALTELHVGAISLAQMSAAGQLPLDTARWGLLGVLAASALAKSVLAFASGGRVYGLRVAGALTAMVVAAGAMVVVA